MRRALLFLLLGGLGGCAAVDAPCLPWDDGCAEAALFAEQVLGSDDWGAVSVSAVECDQTSAWREFEDQDQCWNIALVAVADGERKEVVVAVTTSGDFGLAEASDFNR